MITPDFARFADRFVVSEPDQCWPWLGSKNERGYGWFRLKAERIRHAHRAAWFFMFGHPPNGLFVLHRCDNPPCVNPKHLWLGTTQENTADAVAKGRPLGRPRRISKATGIPIETILFPPRRRTTRSAEVSP